MASFLQVIFPRKREVEKPLLNLDPDPVLTAQIKQARVAQCAAAGNLEDTMRSFLDTHLSMSLSKVN